MNGARTTPWEGLVHCMGTVLDMEAVEDIDEACWLTITVDGAVVGLGRPPWPGGRYLPRRTLRLEVTLEVLEVLSRLGCGLAVQRVASYMGTHDHLVSRTRMSPSSLVWWGGWHLGVCCMLLTGWSPLASQLLCNASSQCPSLVAQW